VVSYHNTIWHHDPEDLDFGTPVKPFGGSHDNNESNLQLRLIDYINVGVMVKTTDTQQIIWIPLTCV